jgi:hypothetical protein
MKETEVATRQLILKQSAEREANNTAREEKAMSSIHRIRSMAAPTTVPWHVSASLYFNQV